MFDVERWLTTGGLLLAMAIIFAESGLFVGFFLPGDSLLFVAGFLTSQAGGSLLPALPVTASLVVVAAIAGDQVGYWFGRKVGPALFSRPRSRLFRPEHAVRAQHFTDRYGPKTIVLARFVPIVRTFAPIVAGVGRMPYRRFVAYNVVGGLLWGVGVTTLGHYLGEIRLVRDNIEVALMAVVALSLVPVAIEVVRARRAVAPAALEVGD